MTDDGTTFRRNALSRRGGIRRRIRSGCALYGLLAAASLAIAPPLRAAPPDLSELPLENLLNVEVYAASRFAQRINDAPANVTVITAAEIKQYGWRTLAEILRSVAGIDVRYDRIYDYIGVRGFSRSADYNTGLTVLIDGYRMNDNIFDTGPIGRELGFDVDLIEKVEVVRGPASALYGGNAVLGVVSVTTRSARSLDGVELAARAGSFGLLQGRASFGKVLDNGAELLLSATALDAGGQSLFFPEFDQPESNFGRTSGTDYERGRSFFGKFSFDYLTVTLAASERTKGNPTGAFGVVFDDQRNALADSNGYLNVSYYRDLSPRDELGLRFYAGKYIYSGKYVFDLPPVALDDDSARGRWWGAEAKLVRRLGSGRVVLGAEYQRNDQQDQRSYYDDPYELVTDVRYTSDRAGFYVDGELPVLDGLILSGGLRLDKYADYKSQWSPRVAAIYKPSEATVFKLIYGAGFRIPSAFERLYSFPEDTLPNPQLSPERASNFEAVFEHYLAPRTRVLATAYRYRIAGVLIQVPDEATGASQFRNGPAATGRGVELELEHLWQNGARLRASAVGGDISNSDGTQLPLALEQQAKLNLSLPLPGTPLNLGVEGRWSGPRSTEVGEVGGFGLLNLTLLYPNDKRGLEASFSVYNLFDRKYSDPVAFDPALPTRSGIEQDGRSVRFMLQYRF